MTNKELINTLQQFPMESVVGFTKDDGLPGSILNLIRFNVNPHLEKDQIILFNIERDYLLLNEVEEIIKSAKEDN